MYSMHCAIAQLTVEHLESFDKLFKGPKSKISLNKVAVFLLDWYPTVNSPKNIFKVCAREECFLNILTAKTEEKSKQICFACGKVKTNVVQCPFYSMGLHNKL